MSPWRPTRPTSGSSCSRNTAIALFHSLSCYFMAAAARYTDSPLQELSIKSACLGMADYVVRLLLTNDLASTEWLDRLLPGPC